MLSDHDELVPNGNLLQVTAIDGSTRDIPIGKAKFYVLEEPTRPSRLGITDYLLCRKHFHLCAMWDDEVGSHVEPIYCTSRGSNVVIDHVGLIME